MALYFPFVSEIIHLTVSVLRYVKNNYVGVTRKLSEIIIKVRCYKSLWSTEIILYDGRLDRLLLLFICLVILVTRSGSECVIVHRIMSL